MSIAPLPENEAERLAALYEYGILDTPLEDAYDDIVRLAASICAVPYAAVTLIDAKRQWFKSVRGIGVTELPRDASLCARTILQTDLMIVRDAAQDPRFQDSPLVTGEPHVRFYVGVPLVTEGGHALGSLCVADRAPRIGLTPVQEDALHVLARQVVGRMGMARREAERERLVAERELAAEVQRAGDQSLRQLAAALEAATDGIVVADASRPDLPITYANPAFLALTGYEMSEVLGRSCRFLQGAYTDPDARQRIRRSVSMRLPCRVTLLNYRKDGSTFWNELTVAPVRDGQGGTTHFVGVQHDITALKESEAALQESNRALQRSQARLVEAQRIGGIGDWELDVTTRRFTWSAEVFRLMEFDPAHGEPPYEEVVARYAPEDRAERDRLFARALETGEPYQCDLRLILPSGTRRWWHLVGQPVLDAEGRVTRVSGTALDITERRRQEEALREQADQLRREREALRWSNRALQESEARLADAQQLAHVGSWELDLRTGTRTWSEELYRICGIDPAQGPPDQAALRACYHPDDLPRHDQGLAELLATGQPHQMDARAVRPDGEVRWCHLTARPVRDERGEIVRVVGTAADITERVSSEHALRQSREERLESERRLRLALTGGWLGWWHLDLATGQYLEFSDQCKAHFGMPPDAPPRYGDFEASIHPEDRARVDSAQRRALENREEYAAEYRVLWPDGSVHWVSAHGTAEYDEEWRAVRVIGTTQDVTERRRAEEALRQRTEVLESVLSTIPHQVFWKDRESVYLGCNAPFARIAGFSSPEQLVGKCDDDLSWRREEAEGFLGLDHRVLNDGGAIIDQEETYLFPDGRTEFALTSKLPLHDAQGRVIGVLGVSQDITARKALEAERERLLAEAEARADRDPLTGLINHRAFHSRLAAEAARAAREGTTLAVAVLDLDNFKFFNDAYGHAVGDSVLRLVTQRLQQAYHDCDTLARFGGDAFALLLPCVGHTLASDVEARLQADLGCLAYHPEGAVTAIPITASVGAALLPQGGQDWHGALQEADERLLRAKTGGAAETEAGQVRTSMQGAVAGFSMLDALVAAVDNKDRYTRRHSEDVMEYSLTIARELGMGKDERHTVAVAALLHDVGKIGLPDAILRKPGKLTDEEFAAVKMHPQMGAIIVGAVPGLEGTLDAVRHHHERWDGGGYPFGLRGEETPLTARLMAVANSFSAMTTDRPYRKSMDRAKALSILSAGAGTQWDPECVWAFLKAMG